MSKEGLSTGAKIGIGAAIFAGLAAGVAALASSSGSAKKGGLRGAPSRREKTRGALVGKKDCGCGR